MQSFGVVILAGGLGVRFGEPKAFVEFGGKPLWQYQFDVSRCIKGRKETVVVLPNDSMKSDVGSIVHFIKGGNGRARDCLSALEHIESRRVVVLEAARPLVTREQILALAGGLYPNIIYGYQSTDTFYDNDYVMRGEGYQLLGTGGYNTELLRDSYSENEEYCDLNGYIEDCPCDSYILQAMRGVEPVVWDVGPVNNLFKVTYPHDLEILGVIQRQMENKK